MAGPGGGGGAMSEVGIARNINEEVRTAPRSHWGMIRSKLYECIRNTSERKYTQHSTETHAHVQPARSRQSVIDTEPDMPATNRDLNRASGAAFNLGLTSVCHGRYTQAVISSD